MPSIINASSTGSGGIVQTADASGVLQLQSNGTTALTTSGANVTVAGTLTTAAQSIAKASLPAGTVLQVVNATTLSGTTTTGSTFIATALAASITPTSSTSKILIFGQAFATGTQSQSQPQITLYRGATDIVGVNYGFGNMYSNSGGYGETILAFSFLDSPSTTSSTTYTIYLRNNGVGTATLGTSDRRSVITLMEIAA